MTSLLIYIIFGIVQGILEWLPVSSQGQLVLLGIWLNAFDEITIIRLAFWLHFGTMIAVFVYYRDEWWQIINLGNTDMSSIRKFLIFTTLGTAISGIPIRIFLFDVVDWSIFATLFLILIAVALIITGILIYYSRRQEGFRSLESLSIVEMTVVGIAQGFSIIPGISRSGTTMSALLLFRVDSENSFKGSFLMSVPAVIGAIILDILSSYLSDDNLFHNLSVSGILVSNIFAFIFGIVTIATLLEIVRNFNFAYVTSGLGLFLLIVLIL